MSHLSVSVVIPTYNRARFIGRAIDSVLKQTIDGDEIIVVNDGSTDNTEEILEPYQSRIKYIRIDNSGAGVARNTGIEAATGALVAFLDSDDIWLEHKLSLQRRLMAARPDILFSFSDIGWIFEDGRVEHNKLITWHRDDRRWSEILTPGYRFSSVADLPSNAEDLMVYEGDLYALELTANYINTSTLVVRREAAGNALFFAPDFPLYEDWQCFATLARKGTGAYLDTETVYQGCHSDFRLTDADALEAAETRITLIRRIWGSDEEFLRRYPERYQAALDAEYLREAKYYLRRGSTQKAREVLGEMRNPPADYRILSKLPAPVVKTAVRARRLAQYMMGRH